MAQILRGFLAPVKSLLAGTVTFMTGDLLPVVSANLG